LKAKLNNKADLKSAFTMIELIFVIVVIGILSAVAIPRLAATRDDAVIVKGKSQVAAIRSGIAMQKAKALLQGDNTDPYGNNFRLTKLDNEAFPSPEGKKLFYFGDGNQSNVLESPIVSKTTGTGGWIKDGNNTYTFKMTNSDSVQFTYSPTNGIFGCGTSANCLLLTQ